MQLTPHEKIIDEDKFLDWNKSVANGMSSRKKSILAKPYIDRVKLYEKIKSK